MEYLFLGLLVFGGWSLTLWGLYWFVLRKLLRLTDDLTPQQRIELFKTRRQRNLKH